MIHFQGEDYAMQGDLEIRGGGRKEAKQKSGNPAFTKYENMEEGDIAREIIKQKQRGYLTDTNQGPQNYHQNSQPSLSHPEMLFMDQNRQRNPNKGLFFIPGEDSHQESPQDPHDPFQQQIDLNDPEYQQQLMLERNAMLEYQNQMQGQYQNLQGRIGDMESLSKNLNIDDIVGSSLGDAISKMISDHGID
jgi:hypothetical protein